MGTHFITDTRGTTGEYFIQVTTRDRRFFELLQEATRKQMDLEDVQRKYTQQLIDSKTLPNLI